MDAFTDRLSQRARDTGRPDLALQCQGRPLTPAEDALATALMDIYRTGEHDFDKVAQALTDQGVAAPKSGATRWTRELLAQELAAINADLDAAYAEHGYGA